MKNSILEGIYTAIFYVVMIYFQFFGIFHAFNSHGSGDGIITVILPPFAWYRSLEFWWHDDYSGFDWSQRLDEDALVVISAINLKISDDAGDRQKYVEAMDFVRGRVRGYPSDKMEELSRIVSTYIEFNLHIAENLRGELEKYLNTGEPILIQSDFEMGQLFVELEGYPQTLQVLEQEINAVKLLFDRSNPLPETGEIELILSAYDFGVGIAKDEMLFIYQNIFGFPFIEGRVRIRGIFH